MLVVVGAGAAGLDGRRDARALRHRVPAGRAPARRPRPCRGPPPSAPARWSCCARWGLEEEIRAGGVDVEWLMWRCETLAEAADGAGLHVGLPTREQSALISPTAPACVPQDHLEPVLLAHLRSLGPARVELGTELVADRVPAGWRPSDRPRPRRRRRGSVRDALPRRGRRCLQHCPRPARSTHARLPGHPRRRHVAVPCSALGRCSAEHRYGIYCHRPSRSRGRVPPRRSGRPLGIRATSARQATAGVPSRARSRCPSGSGSPRASPTCRCGIERLGAFSSAAQLARALPPRQRVPRRRRRAPRHSRAAARV